MSRVLELPSSREPDVAIVVVATRDADRLERCLRAIVAAGTDGLGMQVVLCANAADPDVVQLVDAAAGAVVVRSGFDLGTAASWNLGVAAAAAPRFAIVHEDAFVEPGWLGVLVEQLDCDPRRGVVAPRMLTPSGATLDQGCVVWRDGRPWRIDAAAAPGLEITTPTPVDFVGSATMLADRALWEAVGGFDEGTFPGLMVDVDFGTAAWAMGRTVVTVPSARSTHDQGAALVAGAGWRYTRVFRQHLGEQNVARFEQRWSHLLADHLAAPERVPDTDMVRAALERVANEAAAPGERRPLPSRARVLTQGADGACEVPPQVEERARAMLAERHEAFTAWLVAGRERQDADVAAFQAAIDGKDLDARMAEAAAFNERARAERAETEAARSQTLAERAAEELAARDATLTWRLRKRALSVGGLGAGWRALRRSRGRPPQ